MTGISSITPRTETIYLFQGDDEERIRDLDRRAREAQKSAASSGPRLLAEGEDWHDLAQQHDALVVEARERAVKVVVRALGRRTWRQLVSEHPPREGNAEDQAAGINEETFADALVPVSIASPTFESDAARDDFLDSLNDAQFNGLYLTAFFLNRGTQASPKASLVSALTPTSTETSN